VKPYEYHPTTRESMHRLFFARIHHLWSFFWREVIRNIVINKDTILLVFLCLFSKHVLKGVCQWWFLLVCFSWLTGTKWGDFIKCIMVHLYRLKKVITHYLLLVVWNAQCSTLSCVYPFFAKWTHATNFNCTTNWGFQLYFVTKTYLILLRGRQRGSRFNTKATKNK